MGVTVCRWSVWLTVCSSSVVGVLVCRVGGVVVWADDVHGGGCCASSDTGHIPRSRSSLCIMTYLHYIANILCGSSLHPCLLDRQ